MKKQFIIRSCIGAPIGVMISIIITIIISLCTGHGTYYPVPLELIDLCGNEISAVGIQFVCSLLMGAAFGGASIIWNIDKWNLTKQTLLHFTIICFASFPMAFFMYWVPHYLYGALAYFGIFILIYGIIWISTYISIKIKIKKMNDNLSTSQTIL
ncbi:MAG TPA: DUF3021 domain-containing protein [Candidatus Pelethenecus sp.]|jgi:Protein of unknown function (DUF3021).|nr:DUF3021 domain-containing protein [Candidatus Pelethenecus sp.]